MLHISKYEVSDTLENVTFAFPAFVHELSELLAFKSNQYRVTLHTELNQGIPRFLIGDANKLRHILLSLVSNTMKFCDAREVEFTVSTRKLKNKKTRVNFTIEGHTPQGETLKDIAKNTRSDHDYIPLDQCQWLIDMIGATIKITPINEHRLSFTLSYDMALGHRKDMLTRHPIYYLTNCRILVIDHDPHTLSMFNEYVNLWHMRYHAVKDVNEALILMTNALAEDDPYQIVLAGDHLTKEELKKLSDTIYDTKGLKQTSIVAIHREEQAFTNEWLAKHHIVALLQKPFTMSSLYHILMKGLIRTHVEHNYTPINMVDTYAQTHSRVLVVDHRIYDDQILIALEKRGYTVDLAEDASQALELLENFTYTHLFIGEYLSESEFMNFIEQHAESDTLEHLLSLSATVLLERGKLFHPSHYARLHPKNYLFIPIEGEKLDRLLEN